MHRSILSNLRRAGFCGILAGCLFLIQQSAVANGGGYHYGVEFTGSVAPFEPSGVERVQILDERLRIVVDDEEAQVEVHYVMQNTTDEDTSVTFGFPVEARDGDKLDFSWDLESDKNGTIEEKEHRLIARKKKELTEAARSHCAGYEFRLDGELQKFEHQLDPLATGEVKPFPGSDILKGVIGWNVSTMSFAPRQKRNITIRYRTIHDYAGWTSTKGIGGLAPAFRYRLSTGGVWAGPIKRGHVTIEFVGAGAKWAKVNKPDGRFKEVDTNLWAWEFENLEPQLADDIEVLAGPEFESVGEKAFFDEKREDAIFHLAKQRWQVGHQRFLAVASSTREPLEEISYGAENVHGGEFFSAEYNSGKQAWCEGVPGNGIGESLILNVDYPLPLDELRIRPGYGKSETLFKANGRPAELLVILNGGYRFTAKLSDRNQIQKIHIPEEYREPVETIVLEIKEVYPGWEFEDTCISHISLIAQLDEQPEIMKPRKR